MGTAELHLAPSTIRSYRCTLRLFTEFLTDGRYGWAVACEQAFGPGEHPVAIAHEYPISAAPHATRRTPEGARVAPGKYTARLGVGVGGKTLARTFEVRLDPRVKLA